MINGLMVSTETHSVRQVAEDFLRWRAARNKTIARKQAVKAKKVASKNTRGRPTSDIRDRAFEMFEGGVSVREVAGALDITYANAHYYKRAFAKGAK